LSIASVGRRRAPPPRPEGTVDERAPKLAHLGGGEHEVGGAAHTGDGLSPHPVAKPAAVDCRANGQFRPGVTGPIPERAVTGLSTELNMPVDDLLAAPFLLVGSDDEILTAIRQRPRNDRVGYREATTTLESMTIWLTRF
jgi:hypothetical protein